MGNVPAVGSLVSLFLLIIPFVLGYFIIQLAVRHGIDSSETAQRIKKIQEQNSVDHKEKD